MHNENNTGKPVSAGSLAYRAFFICLAFLIIPLIIHSFFQYQKEVELEREEVQLEAQVDGPHFHKTNFFIEITSFLAIELVIGGGLVFLLLRKLAKPLNVLRLTMARVAEGAVDSRYVNQRFGFEINTIGEYFNETVDALLLHQKKAEEEKIQKERLAEKLQLAQDIQADLLPKKIPIAPHLDIGASYLPALEVGGDFYDVLPLSSGKILLVLADIADKGISACLFSLGLRSSLRALAESLGDNIPELLRKANDLFMLDAEETSQFATVWLGILDGNLLSYVSLGHPPALLKRNGELIELSTGHPSMGLGHLDEITVSKYELNSRDELFIYSDGATEAHNVDGALYGMVRLKNAFLRTTSSSAAQISKSILSEIQSFSHGISQHDDLTLLLIRFI